MIKYGLFFCLVFSVVIAGLTLPQLPPSLRDPVPPSQKVAHSNHCSGCHGYDPTGQALVDKSGKDVNIHDDWQISMMGLAAHDPFWRAQMAFEVDKYPSAQQHIESTCLKCHSPLGSIQAQLDGQTYSYAQMLEDSLGLDGVSCGACHQQPMQGLGKGHTGNFTIDTNRVFFGQYPDPFKGSMQIYVGFEPEFSDHIYSSGICAGCHTLITETLDENGNPTGNFFAEQATYHEWLNSSFPAQGKECQTCHLPFIADEVVIATDLLALEPRAPYGLHQFFGANTTMLTLMHEFQDSLNLPKGSSDAAWTETIDNTRLSLKNAATVQVTETSVFNDSLYVKATIKNKTGHKLPSGYPSRLAWLQVVLLDHDDPLDTLYANGLMDANGHIIGRDLPAEPHHEIIRDEGDVQIYELAMANLQGHLTTTLNEAAHPLKDNRLLPTGFRKTHAAYDTVAIWGEANVDENYNEESHLGQDDIEFRIALDGRKGFGDLKISFHYSALPARWMEDLFSADHLPLVSNFKSMYQDYSTFHEVMAEIEVSEIDLNSVSTADEFAKHDFQLMPNPFAGDALHLHIPGDWSTRKLTYQILNTASVEIQDGKLASRISIDKQLIPGTYFFLVFEKDRLVGLKKFIAL